MENQIDRLFRCTCGCNDLGIQIVYTPEWDTVEIYAVSLVVPFWQRVKNALRYVFKETPIIQTDILFMDNEWGAFTAFVNRVQTRINEKYEQKKASEEEYYTSVPKED